MKLQATDFAAMIAEKYSDIEIIDRTEVRWWMASGMHTDETILEELHAMHDAGFGGVELCQLNNRNIDKKLYGYGSAQWKNDVRLILNTAIDLGMSVSLTSGAGWSTANVPGLDPDSQMANQCVVLVTEDIPAGGARSGELPASEKLRPAAKLAGAVAVRKLGEKLYDADDYVELTALIQEGKLDWTAPADSGYTIMYYFVQGTAQDAAPAVETSYTINYFDRRGVVALQEYLMENMLDDPQLNAKIRGGNVQFFMDSLEYNEGKGITSWTENFREEFLKRKKYDIMPYLYLLDGAPLTSIWDWSDNADLQGIYAIEDREKNRKIINDVYDVQTMLYMEEFMIPFREWLNSYGIKLRAQISYGKNIEISQPITTVDYPEAENRNQKNQPDMYRLWSGGAHLQNKILSAETGGLNDSGYAYTYQRHLQEAYALYASGYSRIIWHIWSSLYGPEPVWPGYEGGLTQFYKFGTREPSFSDYDEFNNHLGRIQKLLRQGRAGVDVGMLYTKYGQHLVYANAKDWLRDHEPMFFPSMKLQDNGYTYDYFAPEFLTADGVYFDPEAKTLEMGGYKALVLWQEDLSLSAANAVLKLAEQGMPMVIVDGAAVRSPYLSDDVDKLNEAVAALRALPNVAAAANADKVLDALHGFGIAPYVGYAVPNTSLLTQTRREGGNRYVFVYNFGSTESAAELVVDGRVIPCKVDAWTGDVSCAECRCEDGKTIIPISLKAGDVALFAMEASGEAQPVPGDCVETEKPYAITDWELTVESWTASDEILTHSEELMGVHTEEFAVKTAKRNISVKLNELASWNSIEEIGSNVSGKGHYRAVFDWDGKAEGAYLDFGCVVQSMKVYINGKKTKNLSMMYPFTDISELLRVGENTIEIEYSSNLTNVQIARGAIKEMEMFNKFIGYDVSRLEYGPKQALIVPYRVRK